MSLAMVLVCMPLRVLTVAICVIIASRRWRLAVEIAMSVESCSCIVGGVPSVDRSSRGGMMNENESTIDKDRFEMVNLQDTANSRRLIS